ncbi:uncharacterized protein IL334_005665 [Kwoniella shivajii]|uniref:Up-regulated during septation protein 1 domain-containing protein n=1 Tax=Kwoniella shivajii TaxID=564305 RepID=A0ABZ1D464_9TREE|nr:hypothetical protein IL334_005665 [Kwoniella shivajii]
MSAQAGPGPSSMASTSMVPTGARLKVKKRVVNLVNPADPQDFSAQSISLSASSETSTTIEEQEGDRTTPPTIRYTESTQTFNFTPGVRGILRPTGTPGSGNGVRFFPKNKFRIITPNASIQQPTPKPPASPTNSFFSQLLAVTIPSMSPRRAPAPPPNLTKADESWEVPGQEGEVSLIASSGGDRTVEYTNEEDDEEHEVDCSLKEDSWNGQPEIHCSPLSLPNVSIDGSAGNISREGFELPSVDLQLPYDTSNLLSTKFQSEDNASFSLTDLPSTLAPPRDLSPIKEVEQNSQTQDEFWDVPQTNMNISVTSENDSMDISNLTIRRPIPSSDMLAAPDQHISPTPIGRPYSSSSIFADMSAEQAELTWPLTRRDEDEELESNFPSPIRNSPSHSTTPRLGGGGAGDVTQFFDTTMTMSMSLSPPNATVVLRSSPQNKDLIVPTRKLFEAHAAHTQALGSELELYRNLASKLQKEVIERDEVLAKLNVRALEAEVLHNQVHDLKQELLLFKSRKGISPSPSPSPSPSLRAGQKIDSISDRTMAAQSEAKELEIRFAKALADSEEMSRQLLEITKQKESAEDDLREAQSKIRDQEDEERDRLVKEQHSSDEVCQLRNELEYAHHRIEELNTSKKVPEEVQTLQQELDEANQHIADLESSENETHTLRAELNRAHKQLDDYEAKETETDNLRLELDEAYGQIEKAHDQLQILREKDEEISALRAELQSAHEQLDEFESRRTDDSKVQHELDSANAKIADLKVHVKDLTEVKLVDEDEIERLINEIDKLKDGRKREEDTKKKLDEVERRLNIELNRRDEISTRLNGEKEKIRELENDIEELQNALRESQDQLKLSDSRSHRTLSSDASLRNEIAKLRSESASKDLEILNLRKRKVELKEDREMLNIALDSKQQELELMKRKFAVKGIAGSTPLGTSRKVNTQDYADDMSTPLPGSVAGKYSGVQTRRRSSLALQTPLPNVPRHPIQTPLPNQRHGVQLHPSTKISSRVMKIDEENQTPIGSTRRRERMLA